MKKVSKSEEKKDLIQVEKKVQFKEKKCEEGRRTAYPTGNNLSAGIKLGSGRPGPQCISSQGRFWEKDSRLKALKRSPMASQKLHERKNRCEGGGFRRTSSK